MSEPSVSVIVPVYRQEAQLRGCLEALAGQSVPRHTFEVVVANNEPGRPLAHDVAILADRVVDAPRTGSYAARNAALEHTRAAVLAFTDADCRPHENWIERGLSTLAGHGAPARLAGRIRVVADADVARQPAALYERVFAFPQRDYAAQGTSVTANMWTRRSVIETIGPFDARALSTEDKAWGLRAAAAGFTIRYADDVVVDHPARGSYRELAEKTRRTYGGLYTRYGFGRHPYAVRLALSVVTLYLPPRYLVGIARTRDLSARERASVAWIVGRLRIERWREHLRLAAGAEARRA